MAYDLNFDFPNFPNEFELQAENPRRVVQLDRTRRELDPGDHIYTWWGTSTEIDHGIYVSDREVIHFKSGYQNELHSVISSSLDQFLSNREVNVFQYGYHPVLLVADPGENTCTTASADSTEDVLRRARFLLNNSSADYHTWIKTSYDFALYCKTGLILYTGMYAGRNKPVVYALAVTAFVFFFPLRLMQDSFTALAATVVGMYSNCKLSLDIGAHPHYIKVEVDGFAEVEILASHSLGFERTVCFLFRLVSVALICALISLRLSMWSKTRPLVWAPAAFKFLHWHLFHRTFKWRWVFSNQLRNRNRLKFGDHLYTWRSLLYAHHGIYVGDEKVIHLTRGEGHLIADLSPWYILSQIISIYDHQSMPDRCDRVEMCSIDEFLDGGKVYLYYYGVDKAFFIAKSIGGTCTLAHSDPQIRVLRRAAFLVEIGFGPYNLFHNNCEDFAIYCKTGLLVPRIISLGRSGQTTSVVALICVLFCALICAVNTFPLMSSEFVGVLALGYVLYSMWRLFYDTGYRGDARKVAVRELPAFHEFIRFMFRQLLRSVLKFICCAIFISRILFPEASWIRSENCLLDWIVTFATIGFALF